MTLSTTIAIKEYTGDGSTVNFSFPYLVFQSSHLTITVDGVTNTDWVAATYGAGAGVTVTFTTAPANGTDIIIRRIVPFTQTTDFENFDGNPADVTEKQFDLCVMQAQQLDENLDRALVVPVGTSLTTNIISGTIDTSTRVLTLTSSGPALSTVAALDTDITTVLTSVASGDLLQYDGASWVNKNMGEIIDGLTAATAAAGDKLVIADVSDSNNPKEITVQGILDLAGVTSYTVNAQTGVTLTLLDYIGIADTSDSNNNKKALVSDIFGLINGITADTTPAVGDYIVTNDVSDSNNPKAVTIENFYKTINGLTEDVSPVAGADYVITYDASAGAAKKVLISNLSTSGLAAASQAQQEAGSSTAVYTSPGTQHYHPSAAKFWADVSHSGATPTLSTSYNVTSITDEGTGDLTITIANDFSSANWACVVSIEGTTPTTAAEPSSAVITLKAAGSVRIGFFLDNQTNWAVADPQDGWHAVGFGDI